MTDKMRQEYETYIDEDHGTWNILYTRQLEVLQEKAEPRFLNCVRDLLPDMNKDEVLDFRKVTSRLLDKTGWDIEVVNGLIPVEQFFDLLSRKRFSCSTWLRKRSQLDYLEVCRLCSGLRCHGNEVSRQ